MRILRFIGVAFSLLCLLAVAGCSNGHSNSLAAQTGLSAQEGPIALTADPASITIDLNDPETPTDPDTHEAYGETTLTAVVTGELGEPSPGVEVVFTATGGTLASEGAAVTTDAAGKATDVLRVLESGPDSIEVTATSGENSETITVTKTVIAENAPPLADAGADQEAECGTATVLDASASTDPDSTAGTNDGIVKFEWLLGEELLGEGETFEATLPAGTNLVTLRVTDAAGATATDEVTITVADTMPPTVTLSFDPESLWPPNHKMVDVTADVEVSDACPGATPPVVTLLSVESNEAANANGDGNTEPDILGAHIGTEDYHFQLRAERSGGGSGRVYTVVYGVADGAGNDTEVEGEIAVPHDQGH
jgi:PKD domain-containing protein